MNDLVQIATSPEGAKAIIEGGAVIVAIYAISVMNKSNKLYFNHTNDTIDKVANAITQQAVTNQKLADVVENNTRVIEKFFK